MNICIFYKQFTTTKAVAWAKSPNYRFLFTKIRTTYLLRKGLVVHIYANLYLFGYVVRNYRWDSDAIIGEW